MNKATEENLVRFDSSIFSESCSHNLGKVVNPMFMPLIFYRFKSENSGINSFFLLMKRTFMKNLQY